MKCVVCGCDDDMACMPMSCWWVLKRPPLCSECVQFFANVRDVDLRGRIAKLAGLKPLTLTTALRALERGPR